MTRAAALLTALCIVFTPAAGGADFETALEAYMKGNHAVAHREWLELANEGNRDAQYSLGVLYSQGLGVELDVAEAARWFHLAARAGSKAAQFTLAMLYTQGIGVAADLEESARWYRRAAEQGDADAQFALGLMLTRGTGVAQDLREAFQWHRLAAMQGLAVAQASLGIMYLAGENIARNEVCAHAWLSLAALKDNTFAAERRATLAKTMTEDQIAQARTLAQTLRGHGECRVGTP